VRRVRRARAPGAQRASAGRRPRRHCESGLRFRGRLLCGSRAVSSDRVIFCFGVRCSGSAVSIPRACAPDARAQRHRAARGPTFHGHAGGSRGARRHVQGAQSRTRPDPRTGGTRPDGDLSPLETTPETDERLCFEFRDSRDSRERGAARAAPRAGGPPAASFTLSMVNLVIARHVTTHVHAHVTCACACTCACVHHMHMHICTHARYAHTYA